MRDLRRSVKKEENIFLHNTHAFYVDKFSITTYMYLQAFIKMTRIVQVLQVDFVNFERERKERLSQTREEVAAVLEEQKEGMKDSEKGAAFPQSLFGTDERALAEREQKELKRKLNELSEYEEKINFIVGVMKVPDITFCDPR